MTNFQSKHVALLQNKKDCADVYCVTLMGLFQNNYQQDDTYGLSFISGLVVLHSTCFELQGAHHQEFTFLLYRQPLAYFVIFCCIPPVLLRVLFPTRETNNAQSYIYVLLNIFMVQPYTKGQIELYIPGTRFSVDPVAQSVQRLTTGWTARDRIPVGTRFSARPDRPWGPNSLLYNGYRVFPGGKLRPGRAADHLPPSSAAVMEEQSQTCTHSLGHTGPVTGSLYLFTRFGLQMATL